MTCTNTDGVHEEQLEALPHFCLSLLFLECLYPHASSLPGRNKDSFLCSWNTADCSKEQKTQWQTVEPCFKRPATGAQFLPELPGAQVAPSGRPLPSAGYSFSLVQKQSKEEGQIYTESVGKPEK